MSELAANWMDRIATDLRRRARYRQSLSRLTALPEPYRSAAMALHRYCVRLPTRMDAGALARLTSDEADLWQLAVIDGTPVRVILGEDPVDIAEAFARTYAGGQRMKRERIRLTTMIDAIEQRRL
ncbi:hypothetical protein WDJ51_15185 [Rathayibacter sp. YIM 133350]|uniref:hypothetical protein n=1 Tax=Rathayibacter sp. YIM 133350 TaxID=3131992 RepID=UPI00307DD11F